MTKFAVADESVKKAWTEWEGPKRGAVRAIAASLGVPRDWLSRRLSKLGLSVPHSREPNWTPAEDALLATLPLYNPPRAAKLMREHGYNRTATAIVLRAKRLEMSRRATHDTFSAHLAGQLLGLDSKTVGTYCETGLIVAERLDDQRTEQQGGHRWCITPDALRDYIRANIDSIDFRRVDKLAFFSLIDRLPTPATVDTPARDPVKGWTAEKRKRAYQRFGQIIIQVADELNVPANELLTYALKGEIPPEGRDQGFADTRVPDQAALPPPSPRPSAAAQQAKPKPPVRKFEPAPQAKASPKAPLVWTEEREAELRRLAGTMPRADVAEAMGLSDAAVAKAGEHFKISLRYVRPESWTEERVAELRRLAEEEKLTGPQLAAHFGVKESSIAGACHRHSIKKHRAPTAPRPTVAKSLAPRLVASRPAATPIRRSPTVSHNPRATTIAPTLSAAGWVRLQHPDGRWLRMDGLGWVDRKADSYICRTRNLAAARAAFPLARECLERPEEAWRPSDIEHARAIR